MPALGWLVGMEAAMAWHDMARAGGLFSSSWGRKRDPFERRVHDVRTLTRMEMIG